MQWGIQTSHLVINGRILSRPSQRLLALCCLLFNSRYFVLTKPWQLICRGSIKRQINLMIFIFCMFICSGGKKSNHIPYRDSKLTRILQTSLGGNARTAIICTMSPALSHVEQSRNTLLFAASAKEVTNTARVKHGKKQFSSHTKSIAFPNTKHFFYISCKVHYISTCNFLFLVSLLLELMVKQNSLHQLSLSLIFKPFFEWKNELPHYIRMSCDNLDILSAVFFNLYKRI